MRSLNASFFLLIAGLLTFTQTIFLLYSPIPDGMIADWAQGYRLSSSLKAFGISTALALCAALVIFRPTKMVYLISMLLMGLVAWQYMAVELWVHFVDLPEVFAKTSMPFPNYFPFDRPISTVPRLLFHILIPISLFLSLALLLKKKQSEQSDAPNDSPWHA